MNKELNNNEDARKFIQILETADGGCPYCVSNLLKQFIREFPQHKTLAEGKLKMTLTKLNNKKEGKK